jgi:hypothetical protein
MQISTTDLRKLLPISDFLLQGNPDCIEIRISESGKQVYYIDKMLKNSPIRCPVTFGTAFNLDQILRDQDVNKWLEQITGLRPKVIWSL